MHLQSESQTPTAPELFSNFRECKTHQQLRVIQIARLRRVVLSPLRVLRRLVK